MHKTTKETVITEYGANRRPRGMHSRLTIPTGTRVKPCPDATGDAWIDDLSVIPAFDRFEAEHYGVRIPRANWK